MYFCEENYAPVCQSVIVKCGLHRGEDGIVLWHGVQLTTLWLKPVHLQLKTGHSVVYFGVQQTEQPDWN